MTVAEMDPDIRPGAAIFTQEGRYLGEVGEIEGRSFHVQAAMQPDYWLPLRTVARASDEHVEVAFYLHELGEYRQLTPAA